MKVDPDKQFGPITIDVDDMTLDRAGFDGTILRYSGGGIPRITACQVSARGVSIEIDGAAANTMGMLRAMYRAGFTRQVEELLAHVTAPPDTLN